jgi:type VI secretion system protein ImpE
MGASELFQAGQLTEAIAAAIQDVKDQPGDLSRRTLLFSLLCFEGDLERARKQLDVLGNQVAMSEAPAYANLLAAESTRRRVFNEGQRPKSFGNLSPRLEKHLLAICQLQSQQFDEAKRLLDAAEEERQEISGSLNEVPFDDFADADDLTRSFLEFQQGSDYFWIPFDDMLNLQVVMPKPVRPRDLYWAPCQIVLRSGETQRGFTPALYINSHQVAAPNLKLGHATEFNDIGGGVYGGAGRKQFVAGDADPTPFDLIDLTFI